MKYRRVTNQDFAQIVALQEQNLAWNLNPDQQRDGFLSTEFSLAQFQEMDQQIAVVVARDAEKVCGYLCASSIEFNKQMPFPRAMLEHALTLSYQGKPLATRKFFIANPACVDASYRGQDIFVGLCKQMIAETNAEYEFALSFISTQNQRSRAASEKTNCEILSEFRSAEQSFWLLLYQLKL